MSKHSCSHGFTTARAREEWLRAKGIAPTDSNSSLVANRDPSTPLYFWQLHSLLGWRKIEAIVRAFYVRVYDDNEAPWFKEAFSQISGVEHHINTQAAYWIDAFGGGREYHGGDGRINFHHHHNANSVMNAAGAKRWMEHMTLALNEDIDWSDEDPRVKPCIVDFLKVRMEKYAKTHGWRFDEADFDALASDTPYTEQELREFSASKLRSLARERGIDTAGLTDKDEYVAKLKVTYEQLTTFKVGRLRRLLKQRGISTDGLLEKGELVAAFFPSEVTN
eukprot:m.201718 g.201718  ORF g.201718 m.201718 type:complete len:278 (-) comp21522_c0_seq1:109-942(-)